MRRWRFEQELLTKRLPEVTFIWWGKLLFDRLVNKASIRPKLIKGWRPFGELTFKVVGCNLFLSEFENSRDKERVMEGRPWVFKESLFAVEEFDGLTTPSEIDFEKAAL